MVHQQFECGYCLVNKDEEAISIGDGLLCEGCVREGLVDQFQQALKYEASYPVTWSGVELEPEDFEAYFENWDGFTRAWRQKLLEYSVLPTERLYCQCGEFVRSQSSVSEEDRSKAVECQDCKRVICGKCGILEHDGKECVKVEEFDPSSMENTKKCPRCTRTFLLESGCNHITCPTCHHHYCWLCGEPAKALSGHWNEGSRCPKYGARDAPNPVFDNPENVARAILHDLLQRIVPIYQDFERRLRFPSVADPFILESLKVDNEDDDRAPDNRREAVPPLLYDYVPRPPTAGEIPDLESLIWLPVPVGVVISPRAAAIRDRLRQQFPTVGRQLDTLTTRLNRAISVSDKDRAVVTEVRTRTATILDADDFPDPHPDPVARSLQRFLKSVDALNRALLYNLNMYYYRKGKANWTRILYFHCVIVAQYTRLRDQLLTAPGNWGAVLPVVEKYLIIAPERFAVSDPREDAI